MNDTAGDGFIDGDIVGLDGPFVGLKDGSNVGYGEGALVGVIVGSNVGALDGALVGVVEGFTVG